MALNAYLVLTGETQGKVNGSVTQAGREDSIEIYDVKHGVLAPVDAASGLPTGKRQHKPITVTKPVDKATPILQNILYNNENITEFRLDFWRPDRSGKEVQFYTIELVNASIVGIQLDMANNRYEEGLSLPVMERVSFAYQKIVTTWEDGGITAEDDWEAPRV